MKLPIVYHQIKLIRKLWAKSSSPDKEYMLEELDNTMREIEREHRIDMELLETLEYINE